MANVEQWSCYRLIICINFNFDSGLRALWLGSREIKLVEITDFNLTYISYSRYSPSSALIACNLFF